MTVTVPVRGEPEFRGMLTSTAPLPFAAVPAAGDVIVIQFSEAGRLAVQVHSGLVSTLNRMLSWSNPAPGTETEVGKL